MRAEAEGDERIEECDQACRPIGINKEIYQIQFPVDAVDPLFVLHRAQIAQTAGKGIGKLLHQIADAREHQPVVGIVAH